MQVATVNYSLRMDEADKQRAEQVFKTLGMTFSTGMNIYVKAVGRQQKIPFDLALEEPATTTKTTNAEKEQAYKALRGVLAGREVDLDQARTERILSE